MYPLRAAELKDRSSDIRLRASAADDARSYPARPADELDEPDAGFDVDPSERVTLTPPGAPPPKADPSASLSEVLFRIACGDHEGALAAADALMERVPVVLMTREQLRSEPLGYWELHLLSHIDTISTLAELLVETDVPASDVVRVVCELAERKIIALR